MVMGVPMSMAVSMIVAMTMRVVMLMIVGFIRQVGVQVATHVPEVESFRGKVNSSVISLRCRAD
jgi:hypothetical protein